MQKEAFSHLYVHFQSILFGFFKTLVQCCFCCSECILSFLGSRIRANLAGSQETSGLKLCQTPFIANQTHIMLSNLVFTEHQLHNVLGSVDIWMDKTMPLSFQGWYSDGDVKSHQGTSSVVQWLRFCASISGVLGSIAIQGTKILHATWYGKK